jgi:hypothetical protein
VEENDGLIVLVVSEGVGLDDVQGVTRDEAMHGDDHGEVVLDLDWVGRSCSERAVDIVEETMAAKDGAEVDVPLRDVVGIKVEDDRRRRAHHNGKGGSATDGGDDVGEHVGQQKTEAMTS